MTNFEKDATYAGNAIREIAEKLNLTITSEKQGNVSALCVGTVKFELTGEDGIFLDITITNVEGIDVVVQVYAVRNDFGAYSPSWRLNYVELSQRDLEYTLTQFVNMIRGLRLPTVKGE